MQKLLIAAREAAGLGLTSGIRSAGCKTNGLIAKWRDALLPMPPTWKGCITPRTNQGPVAGDYPMTKLTGPRKPYPTADQFWRAYQNHERPIDLAAREHQLRSEDSPK